MTYRLHLLLLIVLAAPLALSLACDRELESGSTDTAHARTMSSGIVDSVFPPEEALRRFREGLPLVSELGNAEATRDALVRRFVYAIEESDTAALRSMVMTRAEFAYLYYPTSPHARPPAQQPPALVWFLHTQNSEKGVGRALARFGGRSLDVRGYSCDSRPRVEGSNTIWDDCRLRIGASGDTSSIRLFGGVIERERRFKLLSYSNDL
jgi:hypothetical protein